jgi:hypothetical protein
MRTHGLLIYYAWLALFLAALVAVNYVNLRKRRLASDHDRAAVDALLGKLPPDSLTVTWLKDSTVYNGIPYKYLDIIDAAHDNIGANVIGLDNRAANKAYRDLASAIGAYRVLVSLNTFPNSAYSSAWLSNQWPGNQRAETAQKIEKAQYDLVAAYDRFLVVSHKQGLYSIAVKSSDQLI